MATDHDVVVLGSGLAGSITATILARRGYSVAMIERGTHPRMAIGESLVPTSALWFSVLGHRYDVPEIRSLAHLDSICANVAPTSGVKRGFGYVYHRDGQERLDPLESSHFIGAKQPVFRESQLYRPDVDHYLVRTAERYGVTYRDRTEVVGVEIDRDRAALTLGDGNVITARYVIDGTGRSSVLANQFGLREEPCRLRHASRSVFSHFRDVVPFEELAPEADGTRWSAGWSEGTLHHVFDGGWFWVIPFDNHDRSASDLVSVGLTIDANRFPRDPAVAPDEEFRSFVERFPVVQRHLGPAEASREIVGTDRLQYSSSSAVGDRFLLLHHAYGFIDPLFSRGMWRSLETIDVVLAELLPALEDDDLSAERLAAVDRAQAAMLDDNDQMVFNAFRSTSDYDTWTSWLRVWFADEFLTTLPMLAASFRFAADGDLSVFDRFDGEVRPGTGYSFSADLQRVIDEAEAVLDEVDCGTEKPAGARRRIAALLGSMDELPHDLLPLAGGGHIGMDLTPPNLARLIWWGRRHAPDGFRAEAFDYRVRDMVNLVARDALWPRSVRRDRLGNVIPQRSNPPVSEAVG